jgi:hypothetical protein
MVVGLKADFDSFDLAELCANRLRRSISGSKSIKIVSSSRYVEKYPATYSFSARGENGVATPLTILNVSRLNENLTTPPNGLLHHNEHNTKVRLEIICHDEQYTQARKVVLSSGGENIRKI